MPEEEYQDPHNLPTPVWLSALQDDLGAVMRREAKNVIFEEPEEAHPTTRLIPNGLLLRLIGHFQRGKYSESRFYPPRFRLSRDIVLAGTDFTYGTAVAMDLESGLADLQSGLLDGLERRSLLHIPSHNLWIDNTVKTFNGSYEEDILTPTFLSYCVPEILTVVVNPDPVEFARQQKNTHFKLAPPIASIDDLHMRAAVPNWTDVWPRSYDRKDRRKSPKLWVSHHGVTRIEMRDWEWGSGHCRKNYGHVYDQDLSVEENIRLALALAQDEMYLGTPKGQYSETGGEPLFNLSFEAWPDSDSGHHPKQYRPTGTQGPADAASRR